MLKKDLIELCLLQILFSEDLYGYEILRRIHEGFSDTQESSIYALLRGLCKEGSTEQYEGKTSDGPTRKYYRLTEKGKEKRAALLLEWHHLCSTLSALGVE